MGCSKVVFCVVFFVFYPGTVGVVFQEGCEESAGNRDMR